MYLHNNDSHNDISRPAVLLTYSRIACGMSIETLMSLSSALDMSLDYIIYGKTVTEKDYMIQTDEVTAIMKMLDNSTERQREYCMRLLKLFLATCKLPGCLNICNNRVPNYCALKSLLRYSRFIFISYSSGVIST